jgi:uncharacterized protein YqhQ
VGIALAIALFLVLPALVARLVFGSVVTNTLAVSAVEGTIRIAILLLYMLAISALSDVRRVFQYHGAEHKTIAAYEAGDALEPQEIAKKDRRHPRCGTSFLLTVVIVTVVVFAFLRGNLPLWAQLLARVAMLPLVAGIAYEAIRIGWRLRRGLVGKALVAPGIALQAITTREPDEDQIVVALRSLEVLLENARPPELDANPPEIDSS